MNMSSNNWKKRVSDFFFEETEIDMEEEMKEQSGDPVYRTHPTYRKPVNTKVAYQYPKRHDAAFRFPVIPDEYLAEEKASVSSALPRNPNRNRKTKRPHKEHHSLKAGYERKKNAKELEDVPAYIRRQKEREETNVTLPTVDASVHQEETKENKLAGYTRPDELDRVFKARDGHTSSKSQKIEQTEKENEQRKPFRNAAKRQQILTELKQRTQLEKIELQQQKEVQQPDKKTEIKGEENSPIKTVLNVYNDSVYEQPEQEIETVIEPIESIEPKDPFIPVPNYLLNDPIEPDDSDRLWLQQQQHLLNQTLEHFNVDATVVNVTQGPSVTRFEIQPALGVKVSRIRGLSDDIKLNMAAQDIRMEAPIPGKNTIGIEVPNQHPQVVSLQEIIEAEAFEQSTSDLTIALGLTIEGEPLITTIDKMPHGLIAGATVSGKSVCINSIILSLLYKASHEDVKFMMIDPKMVELTPYNGIPHLISPVITDAKAATVALKWAVEEMETRYEKLAEASVRNIQRYNEKMEKEQRAAEKMPYIVIVIDELADLMMVSPQEVEDAVCRIAQKARACGMHLLLATQRPSVDVITGLIKANIPTRIAFSVSSQVDSRTILDTNGAEKLLGKGDMLFIENGSSKSVRLQGPFVSDDEIDRVATFARSIAKPNYLFEQEQLLLEVENEDEDELLQDVISFVVEHGQASTSLLQRRFRIGYNRAARLIDTIEQKGIVSAANGSKTREVLDTKSQIDDVF